MTGTIVATPQAQAMDLVKTKPVSFTKAVKKSISKPFIGKKVAFLKTSVNDLAKDLKRAEEELESAMDQIEDLQRRKVEIKQDISQAEINFAKAVEEHADQLKEEQLAREAEQKQLVLEIETAEKELYEDVLNRKKEQAEKYEDVWSALNLKLEQFRREADEEREQITFETEDIISEKEKIVNKHLKDRRSIKKLIRLSGSSIKRQSIGA